MTPLSARLASLLEEVLPGHPLADIGTDHGLLPIAAVWRERVPHAIASDLRPGPLAGARANVRAHGLTDKVDVRLGDGLATLTPEDELATITIAGMGGATIAGLLERVDPRTLGAQRLVLQVPQQSETLRRALVALGMGIERERLLAFDGRTYTNFRVDPNHPTDTSSWEEADWLMGYEPRRAGGAVFEAWRDAQVTRLQGIARGLSLAKDPDPEALAKVERALAAMQGPSGS